MRPDGSTQQTSADKTSPTVHLPPPDSGTAETDGEVWLAMCEQAVAYYHQHQRFPPWSIPAGRWLNDQRHALVGNTSCPLDPRRRALLDERLPGWSKTIPVPQNLTKHDARWLLHLDDAVAYREQHGRLPPSKSTLLGRWLDTQRQLAKGKSKPKTLAPWRRTLLDQRLPGWSEPVDYDAAWTTRLDEAVAYREQHGRLPPHSTRVGQWLETQRQVAKANKKPLALVPWRRALLDERLPGWSEPVYHDTAWTTQLDEAVAYYEQHGRLPPASTKPGRWLAKQRQLARGTLKPGTLVPWRRAMLDQRLPGWLEPGRNR